MSEHRIALRWQRAGLPFERGNYSRDHRVRFQGGQEIGASSAADYGGNPELADPEQTLLAALSSCHMLTFLAVCANRGYVLEHYEDDALCTLGKDAEGRIMVDAATLRPRTQFSGANVPAADDLERLHERAHRACFIANSVRTAVRIEPQR
jgi:organic hydroperoxide reductase OsmC/OhrA